MQTCSLPFLLRQRLGYVPDSELATEFQCDVQIITAERKRLKIPAFVSNLSADLDSALGSESEPTLAQHIDVSINVVKADWLVRGIDPTRAPFRNLDKATLDKLGTMSDTELARQSGHPSRTIQKARTRLGIVKFSKPKQVTVEVRRPWRYLDEGIILALGTISDSELARRSGRRLSTISNARNVRNIPPFDRKAASAARKMNPKTDQPKTFGYLGSSPDPSLGFVKPPLAMVAKVQRFFPLPTLDHASQHILWWATDGLASRKLGVSVYTVGALRVAYGIPGLLLRSEPPAGLIGELGKVQDLILAHKYNLQARTISKIRTRLGVLSYRSQNKASAQVPQEAITLLGAVPDKQLESQFGLPARIFKQARYEAGILRCDGNSAKVV